MIPFAAYIVPSTSVTSILPFKYNLSQHMDSSSTGLHPKASIKQIGMIHIIKSFLQIQSSGIFPVFIDKFTM